MTETILAAAKKKAAELGLKCNIAVVDDGGHLLAFADDRLAMSLAHVLDDPAHDFRIIVSAGVPSATRDERTCSRSTDGSW